MPVHFELEEGVFTVPDSAQRSLDGLRKWANAEEREKTKLCYIGGEVWIEKGREQLFTHGHVKSEVGSVLHALTKKVGYAWINGVMFTNHQAVLSCNPDVIYVSFESLNSKRVFLTDGFVHGYTEIVGSPDMILEVVSDSSEEKDWNRLRESYFEAGVGEYWIIDARGDVTEFQILKRAAKGFVETRRTAGWLKSAVFGKSFRLTRGQSPQGLPIFSLDVK